MMKTTELLTITASGTLHITDSVDLQVKDLAWCIEGVEREITQIETL